MKIGIVGPVHQKGLDIFRDHQFNFVEITDTNPSNLIEKLKDVDGVVLRTAPLDNNVLEECSKIKIVSRHGVGYDNVDINYLNKSNIALAITGTANAVSVAEHVMAFFLHLTKIINISDELTKKGDFQNKGQLPNFFELYQKNVLILGFGRIGQAVAQRCLGFEMNVYVYDPFVQESIIQAKGCQPITKEEGLRISDYISMHLPLNEKTRNFIDTNEFEKMKKNCILVNTARGGVVNEQSLYKALIEKKIAGTGLDVFDQEPPAIDNPLFGLSNALLTPHNAALTLECRIRMAVESCENVVFFLKQKEELNKNNVINIENINV